MIQADTHKDANKRKTDTTRQTGTCGRTEERMYNCAMCYTTILLCNWRKHWLEKDAECTMSANWCDQRRYSITTWSHLPRIYDTWKWHARSTGLVGQGPLLEEFIVAQLIQDIPSPFSDPTTLKLHYPVHKRQSSNELVSKRQQQIKITLIERLRLQQNQAMFPNILPWVVFLPVYHLQLHQSTAQSNQWLSSTPGIPGSDYWQGHGFFFPKSYRPTLGPTHTLTQWRPSFFNRSQTGYGVKPTTHLHPVPRLRMCGVIPPFLIRLMAWFLFNTKKSITSFWQACREAMNRKTITQNEICKLKF